MAIVDMIVADLVARGDTLDIAKASVKIVYAHNTITGNSIGALPKD